MVGIVLSIESGTDIPANKLKQVISVLNEGALVPEDIIQLCQRKKRTPIFPSRFLDVLFYCFSLNGWQVGKAKQDHTHGQAYRDIDCIMQGLQS